MKRDFIFVTSATSENKMMINVDAIGIICEDSVKDCYSLYFKYYQRWWWSIKESPEEVHTLIYEGVLP
jgi:hypothetical protein